MHTDENHSRVTLQDRLQWLEDENARLREQVRELQREIVRLKGDNPRNAGRRSGDEKWVRGYSEFVRMKKENQSRETIMKELSISRATFYRYQKLFNETGLQADSLEELLNNL